MAPRPRFDPATQARGSPGQYTYRWASHSVFLPCLSLSSSHNIYIISHMWSSALVLALTACWCGSAIAWQQLPRTALHRVAPVSSAHQLVMLAKKQQQPKKRVKKKKSTGPSQAAATFSPTAAAPAPPAASLSGTPSSSFGLVDPDSSLDDRLDSVLQRAGIANTGTESSTPPPAFGRIAAPSPSDPLSRIPKAGQDLLERFFGGGALVFGSAFILSGLAIAVESIAKVLGRPLPTFLDEALVQYVEPALTPSILILFFFSISLGSARTNNVSAECTPHCCADCRVPD